MGMIVVLTCGVVAACALIFNKLVRLKNLMREAESGMDVQLKKRHDLIPNIVESVKGYGAYEQKTLQEVTRLRAGFLGEKSVKEKADFENQVSGVLKTIFALVENYPDLKANRSFLDLQKNLVDIEDQIQMARRYYNGTVRNYNILVESVPSNLVAVVFGFKQAEFFEIDYVTERSVPELRL